MRSGKPINPFALPTDQPAPARRWVLFAVIITAAIGLAFMAVDGSRRWMMQRIVSGVETLPLDEQHQRLRLLMELGEPGVDALVKEMLLSDSQLAQSAYQILTNSQDEWATRWPERADAMHRRLTTALESQQQAIDTQRWTWVEQLASQSLLDTLHSQSRDGQAAYAAAVRLLALRSIRRPPLDSGNDAPLLRVAEGQVEAIRPPTFTPEATPPLETVQEKTSADPMVDAVDPATAQPNTVYRPQSTVSLIVPAPVVTDILGLERPPTATDSAAVPGSTLAGSANGTVAPASLTTDTLELYETRDVIDLLVSPQPHLVQVATAELTRRGFKAGDLQAALQLASTDPQTRSALVQSLSQQSEIDPRPFLEWLIADEDRQVRLAAINVYATMDDPRVRLQLQRRLSVEIDPLVAQQIRKAIHR